MIATTRFLPRLLAATTTNRSMSQIVFRGNNPKILRHPNIIQLYGLWRGYDPDLATMRFFMVLEFCGGGTLAEAMDSRDSGVSVVTSPYGQHVCMPILNLCLGGVVESPVCGIIVVTVADIFWSQFR